MPSEPGAPVDGAPADREHDEDRARELFTRVVERYLDRGTVVETLGILYVIGLGPSPPLWMPRGAVADAALRRDQADRDALAWAFVQEGLRFTLFTAGDPALDQLLAEPTTTGLQGREHCVEAGTRILSSASQRRHRVLARLSRTRRPSPELVEAFAAYHAPRDDLRRRLAALPAADGRALVEYITSGTGHDPAAWSLLHGVRLEPVTWPDLAPALAAAGVPQRGTVYFAPRVTPFGHRQDKAPGWVVRVRRDLSWDPQGDMVEYLLADGRLVDGGGHLMSDSGPVSPEWVREVVVSSRDTHPA